MSRGTLDTAMSARLSCTGLSPSLAGFPKTFPLNLLNQFRGPNPGMHARRFGLFPFRSPLLWKSHVVFFSSGYLDVSVHRVPDAWLTGFTTNLRSTSRLPIATRIFLCDWYLACTGLSIPGSRSPYVSPQFCHTAVQEYQPVVHRLRLSPSP